VEPLTAVGLKLIDFLIGAWHRLLRVRVLAHRAVLFNTSEPCLFINVTNLTRTREIEITHVWLETDPRFDVLNLDRPLPKRLKPDETWETWVPLELVPNGQREAVLSLGRIQLSNGRILRTVHRSRVPAAGFVPG
jgi:hypothetical protein